MKHSFLSLLTACALSGCADFYLTEEIRRVEGDHVSLDSFEKAEKLTVNTTMKLAFEMADGYAAAAQKTAITQDIASAGLIVSAGSAALGLANNVANEILTDRVVTAVMVESFLRRGVPKDAIVALYDGASRHNCVALTGRLYTQVDLSTMKPAGSQPAGAIEDKFAAFLMVLVMREIEYRTYAGLSRDLESFGTLFDAFSGAITKVESPEEVAQEGATSGNGKSSSKTTDTLKKRAQPKLVENPGLVRFFKVLSGCLSKPTDGQSVAPNTTKT